MKISRKQLRKLIQETLKDKRYIVGDDDQVYSAKDAYKSGIQGIKSHPSLGKLMVGSEESKEQAKALAMDVGILPGLG